MIPPIEINPLLIGDLTPANPFFTASIFTMPAAKSRDVLLNPRRYTKQAQQQVFRPNIASGGSFCPRLYLPDCHRHKTEFQGVARLFRYACSELAW